MASTQPVRRFGNTPRRAFAPPSDAVRAAALLDREELLIENVRCVSEASYRQREEIELELGDIRRELERLGF
jgi:hypothetical protein